MSLMIEGWVDFWCPDSNHKKPCCQHHGITTVGVSSKQAGGVNKGMVYFSKGGIKNNEGRSGGKKEEEEKARFRRFVSSLLCGKETVKVT